MIINLKVVKIHSEYCNYLRQFDNKIPYNNFDKELRPFVGILFEVGEYKYFAPLTSPKLKHRTMKNNIDFLKIKSGILGAVNFNNMLPVTESNYSLIDLNVSSGSIKDQKYLKLLKEQVRWLNKNYIQVKTKAWRLYHLYNENKLPKTIQSRCCNFKLLESKCQLYSKTE